MRVELDPHELKALGVFVAGVVLEAMAPRLAALEATIQGALEAGQAKAQAAHGLLAPAMGSAVITRKQVQQITGLGRTTLWRLEAEGQFPAKVRLSSGRVGWMEAEVVRWIEGQRVV